ncbi:MAG: preprotein translocase subunit SecG [Crenarchaeota archaeon]|nr:preprotein translocase subunit SecG [Thermoproteota archaeon]
MSSILTFLFIVQIVISVLLILLVLVQQSEEDSLSGIGAGASQKMLSKRSSSTPISKMTMILFISFMLNSLILATISARNYGVVNKSIENLVDKKNNEK